MSELDRLIEAVDAGEAWPRQFDSLNRPLATMAMQAMMGSLDAALGLLNAKLNGAHWHLYEDDDLGYVAGIKFGEWHSANSDTPARAMLLAFLRAYRSTATEPQAHRHS